ncbi:hypothetical protein BCR36DRAFT_583628 [Piromyces finnis]|uniref:Uncharacterized protein n=1 Tax=Piromyces finnis TaxID=1754191 RepID=A0A1Y1V8S0_9FUNG|nr:hypothetical protein BCR36DRAFT_583628 [Piromyces finnis]|eukprot:ORX50024.1 hypothetical protein BCR36DRAFT_583628 [Piromyces finnis]
MSRKKDSLNIHSLESEKENPTKHKIDDNIQPFSKQPKINSYQNASNLNNQNYDHIVKEQNVTSTDNIYNLTESSTKKENNEISNKTYKSIYYPSNINLNTMRSNPIPIPIPTNPTISYRIEKHNNSSSNISPRPALNQYNLTNPSLIQYSTSNSNLNPYQTKSNYSSTDSPSLNQYNINSKYPETTNNPSLDKYPSVSNMNINQYTSSPSSNLNPFSSLSNSSLEKYLPTSCTNLKQNSMISTSLDSFVVQGSSLEQCSLNNSNTVNQFATKNSIDTSSTEESTDFNVKIQMKTVSDYPSSDKAIKNNTITNYISTESNITFPSLNPFNSSLIMKQTSPTHNNLINININIPNSGDTISDINKSIYLSNQSQSFTSINSATSYKKPI